MKNTLLLGLLLLVNSFSLMSMAHEKFQLYKIKLIGSKTYPQAVIDKVNYLQSVDEIKNVDIKQNTIPVTITFEGTQKSFNAIKQTISDNEGLNDNVGK